MELDVIIQQFFNTVSLVSIFILVALGLAIIFGMMGVINLAHGEFFLLGSYIVYILSSKMIYSGEALGLSVYMAIPIATVACGIFGLFLDRVLIRHLYERPLDSLLATWALSIFIRELIKIVIGPEPKPIHDPLAGYFQFLDVTMPKWRLFVMSATIITLLVLYFVFKYTPFGLKSRAAMKNKDMAWALGIDIKRVYSLTFMIGTALAGLAGALIAPLVSVYPELGLSYLIKSFFVVIIGGVGNLANILAGGGTLGGAYGVFTFFLSPILGEVLVFLLAIVILRIKPTGLMGRR